MRTVDEYSVNVIVGSVVVAPYSLRRDRQLIQAYQALKKEGVATWSTYVSVVVACIVRVLVVVLVVHLLVTVMVVVLVFLAVAWR